MNLNKNYDIFSIQERETDFHSLNNLLPFDGSLYLIKEFYLFEKAQEIFNLLKSDLAWQQEKIFLYGRWVEVPRLMCWYGDEGANYQYSGVNHSPLPWIQLLSEIKNKIESENDYSFNSVMANLYRDGSDSMGCHADDEKELGANPLIASLSFGEDRLLKFRHNDSNEVVDVVLTHGDLLIMAGKIQHYWKHELPKTKKLKLERINLTFRKIMW